MPLKIRPEMLKAFDENLLARQEQELLALAREQAPERSAELGEGKLTQYARIARDRARALGAATERGVRLYFQALLLLGAEFEKDGRHPWANAILASRGFPGPEQRLQRLADVALVRHRLEEKRG
jgi:hypothetical protein